MEKQRDKAARRLQRKLDPKETGEVEVEVESTPEAEGTDDLLAGVDAEPSAKSL